MKNINNRIKYCVGNRIKELRLSYGLTQEQLAEKSDLHRTYIGSCERGERNITIQNIYKICTALGIELKCFFNFDL
ncbi:helix-turn-helix domain-containing protein [Leclercia adecarboxylata]|uniref:helix-turn-helix domain-containing protein n=1 Tax=Leclercia adecarboxylata TaxID=83655 RepID=UPI0009006F1A|nr:helix-turn-helix transcriptional regulator [Leclercia adecarboxylata]